ncbi:MAG: NACHT domain-containing protein, partial [Actinomycetota bacterium]|nr:NACHT domain-containing protein [Actinomycetota bacterium]
MIGQSGLIVAVLALVAFVVFKPQSDRFCDHHKVGCSLTTGFLSTGVVLLAGYFVLFVWTIRKAQSYYVKLARETPDRLMDSPPRVRANDVVGREQLTRTLARESAFATHGAPIVVVGDAGSGKTTFLLKLTQHLAETGSVPVDVSLRAASLPLSFRRLAQDEFVRRIDPVVRAETDATRIWRKLCAQGAIVVLADGLDEVAVELPRRERDHVI